MISSTSTTSTSGVMLISDCRLELESLLLNCMMSLSFCAGALGDQPHPAEAGLLDREHRLPDLDEMERCIAADYDTWVRLGAHCGVEGFTAMLGGDWPSGSSTASCSASGTFNKWLTSWHDARVIWTWKVSMLPVKWVKAPTAGIATTIPRAVDTRASAMPPDTKYIPPDPAAAML